MNNIICFNEAKEKKDYRSIKMTTELVKEIRAKEKNIRDMPKRAEEVLKYFNINDFSSGVPIVDILIKFGIKTYQSELEPAGLSAYIAVNPTYEEIFGSNKITCVNIRDSIGHKRFALAHELAHYLFDFDESKKMYYYNTYFPKQEEENEEEMRANSFAANILMPAESFQRKIKECENIQSKLDMVSYLAQFFGVSTRAVLKRFTELGLEGYSD